MCFLNQEYCPIREVTLYAAAQLHEKTRCCWLYLEDLHLFLQQGTASEATLMSLLAARCKAVRRVQVSKPEKSEAEIFSKLVAYTSEQV